MDEFTKEYKRRLVCPTNPSRNGLYTLFLYDDDPIWMTAYHEDTKTEYYMRREEFKNLYKKEEQLAKH